MLPKAHLHHELPLRFRLYVPSKKGEDSFFRELKERLIECDDVDGVEVNPKTGSVVVFHHGKTAEIIKFAETASCYSAKNPAAKGGSSRAYKKTICPSKKT